MALWKFFLTFRKALNHTECRHAAHFIWCVLHGLVMNQRLTPEFDTPEEKREWEQAGYGPWNMNVTTSPLLHVRDILMSILIIVHTTKCDPITGIAGFRCAGRHESSSQGNFLMVFGLIGYICVPLCCRVQHIRAHISIGYQGCLHVLSLCVWHPERTILLCTWKRSSPRLLWARQSLRARSAQLQITRTK